MRRAGRVVLRSACGAAARPTVVGLALLVAACTAPATTGPTPAWIADTSAVPPSGSAAATFVDRYREVAKAIIDYAHADRGAYQKLATLTDTIGHRLSGSPELDRAIAWAAQAMTDDGLDVHTEKVMIPHWVRGAESGAIVSAGGRVLHLIGLGGSIATPTGGLTAPLVVVHDWAELAAKADSVKGAIVLFDVVMPPFTEESGPGYGKVAGFRFAGASAAAKLGATGMLIRSLTERSLGAPHTGSLVYADGAPKIPGAAVTVEDADLLDRLAQRGPVTVHLELHEQQLPDVESANVIGELRGTDKADEVVVIGGHIDSWDVGQGAHDDGAGIVTMMETLRVLHDLHLRPRRTIRAVLFVNEENGARGAKAYAEQHKAELAKTVMALESDTGGFTPLGFSVSVEKPEPAGSAAPSGSAAPPSPALVRIAAIATLLVPIHATRVRAGHGGTDIEPMAAAGVPQVGLSVDTRHYFDYHHSEADTLDKVDPQQLADDVGAVAVLAYIVADMPDSLGAPLRTASTSP